MATSIDVFFTGLMLICLDGQPNCPVRQGWNTAWVVKADGRSRPCGRHSPEKTQLQMTFKPTDFDNSSYPSNCHRTQEREQDIILCVLQDRDICVGVDNGTAAGDNYIDKTFENLLRIDEVDSRFKSVREDLLSDTRYVSASVHFPPGTIGSGQNWPKDDSAIKWSRSNGSETQGGLPRELSDRLKAKYQTKYITVGSCTNDKPWITLRSKGEYASVVFRNSSIANLIPNHVDRYDYLGYLLWYYRLGSWDTLFKKCPAYTPNNKKGTVVLRCERKKKDGCAFDTSAAADTTFWPPVVNPPKTENLSGTPLETLQDRTTQDSFIASRVEYIARELEGFLEPLKYRRPGPRRTARRCIG